MRNFFEQLNPKSFQISCILACLFGDLSFAAYIYQIFSNKKAYMETFNLIRGPLKESFKQQGLVLPPNIEHEFFQVMIQTLMLVLSLFILAHGLIYFFYWIKKRFAFLYIRFMAILGAFGALMFCFGSSQNGVVWPIFFFCVFLAYIFVLSGTHYFPISNKSNQE